jgi:putative membrane protein
MLTRRIRKAAGAGGLGHRRAVRVGWAAGVGIAAAPVALAHGGAVADVAWWAQWNAHPFIICNLALLAAVYTLGWRRRHRLQPPPAGVRWWQSWAFAAALVALVAALLSPLDVFATELLTVHMIQHMVLMNLAAPLFVLGAPGRVMWWALADERRHDWAR